MQSGEGSEPPLNPVPEPRVTTAVFVWSEAAYVTVGGLATGALGGWALTQILIKILTGVFDPPPTTLAVPWGYLILVAGVAIAAVIVAATAAIRSTRRPAVHLLRDI